MTSDIPIAKRGRPTGSGRDDRQTLAAIADAILADPALKPTTAMKRVVRKIGESDLRRLQVKWQKNGAALLAEADSRKQKQEAARAAARRAQQSMSSYGLAMKANPHMLVDIMRLTESPLMKQIREMQDSPIMQQMRKMQEFNAQFIKPSPLDVGKPEWMKHHEQMLAMIDPLGLRRQK